MDSGPRGVEAGARHARYAALGQLARHFGADRVLSDRDDSQRAYEDVDPHLHDVLSQMLVKDPEQRIKLRDGKLEYK